MTLTRYRDDAPVDYMVLADDGEWVPASEALELQTERDTLRSKAENLQAACKVLRSDIAQMGDEADRLRALLTRCATALEAVPDPSAYDLALIEEAKRG